MQDKIKPIEKVNNHWLNKMKEKLELPIKPIISSGVANAGAQLSEAIHFIDHPQLTPLYKRVWIRLRRPKFSKESIEKAWQINADEALARDQFKCKRCSLVWGFCPEDFDLDGAEYPNTCPFCSMPFWEMVKMIYSEEDGWEVLKHIIRRYLRIKIKV